VRPLLAGNKVASLCFFLRGENYSALWPARAFSAPDLPLTLPLCLRVFVPWCEILPEFVPFMRFYLAKFPISRYNFIIEEKSLWATIFVAAGMVFYISCVASFYQGLKI